MAETYLTNPGEALDAICARHYGARVDAVAVVLEANPQLAAVAHALPAGTRITLPDLAEALPSQNRAPALWG